MMKDTILKNSGKSLYPLCYIRRCMPNDGQRNTTHNYGLRVIPALKDIKLKFKDTEYQRIDILEEAEPIGTQRLRTEDIIEEIDKLPENIRKYITSIVLFPFSFPDDDVNDPVLASADWSKKQIIIYAISQDRQTLKDTLASNLTLAHEAGHIIDGCVLRNTGNSSYFLSYTPRWAMAMCADSKIKRTRDDLPLYLVSVYAEKRQSLGEDLQIL